MIFLGGLLKTILGLLKGIPPIAWVVLVVAIWGWQGHHKAKVLKTAWDKERVEAIATAKAATEKNQAETQRRAIAAEGVTNAIAEKLAVANGRNAADVDTIGKLRRAIAATSRRRAMPSDPPTLSPGEANDRLGEVADGCVRRLGEVVAAARRAAIAGAGCEAQYNALTR